MDDMLLLHEGDAPNFLPFCSKCSDSLTLLLTVVISPILTLGPV